MNSYSVPQNAVNGRSFMSSPRHEHRAVRSFGERRSSSEKTSPRPVGRCPTAVYLDYRIAVSALAARSPECSAAPTVKPKAA